MTSVDVGIWKLGSNLDSISFTCLTSLGNDAFFLNITFFRRNGVCNIKTPTSTKALGWKKKPKRVTEGLQSLQADSQTGLQVSRVVSSVKWRPARENDKAQGRCRQGAISISAPEEGDERINDQNAVTSAAIGEPCPVGTKPVRVQTQALPNSKQSE